MTQLAVLTALALALTLTETLFFPEGLFPVPGMRLGLANVVTILVIYLYGAWPAFAIVVMRSLIAFAFGGNLTAFLLSMCGGTAALLIMRLLAFRGRFSVYGISAAGAAAHNIGQILAVCALTRTAAVLSYLPVLLAAGLFTGLFVGLIVNLVYPAVAKARRIRG